MLRQSSWLRLISFAVALGNSLKVNFCLCMYVCMIVCMLCMYVCMYVIYVCMYVCYVCLYVHLYVMYNKCTCFAGFAVCLCFRRLHMQTYIHHAHTDTYECTYICGHVASLGYLKCTHVRGNPYQHATSSSSNNNNATYIYALPNV